MNVEINRFLSQFLTTPKGTSKQPVIDRARHWVAVLQSPAEFYPQADEYELRHRYRQAKQNLRRLLNRHPELLTMLREVSQ